MICEYCKRDPGNKANGLWKGFRDGDTGQLVCWKHQALHYRTKFKNPDLRGLYSEFPVMNMPAQLRLNFSE